MGDRVYCDGCGKVGHRRIGALGPEGWSAAQIRIEGQDSDTGHDGVWIVFACSEACKALPWEECPGKLMSRARERFTYGKADPLADRLADALEEVERLRTQLAAPEVEGPGVGWPVST